MLPIMVAVGIFSVPEYLRSSLFFKSLFLYGSLLVAVVLGGQNDDGIIQIFCSICLYMAVSVFTFYFCKSNQNRHLRATFYSTVFFIIVTTIASYIINESFPNIIRYSGHGEQEEAFKDLVTSLQRYGLSSFDIVHALPVLIPVFILGYKSKGISIFKRTFYLFMSFVCLFQVYISGSVTPLLLTIMVLLVSLVLKVGSIKSNVLILVGFSVLSYIVLSPQILSAILNSFSTVVGNDAGELQLRLSDVNETLTTGSADTGDIGLRMGHYQDSLDAFYNNIIWGAGSSQKGGHSFILDTLGAYGIVGGMAFLLYFISLMSYIIRRIPANFVSFYVLSIIAAIIMLASKNTGTWATWCFLFIVAPVFVKYIGLMSEKKL